MAHLLEQLSPQAGRSPQQYLQKAKENMWQPPQEVPIRSKL
jgi:hypothetical protein